MELYFITYDLHQEKDYQKLYDVLNSLNAVRVLKSTWCFYRKNSSAKELRDYFMQFVDEDDSILVDKSLEWATYNTLSNPQSINY